ncbi:MAG: cob(I)yrinic acid a,c-diamide adenosyltransferase [Betaproteobacteria bacterium]|nr:cob(I)yrinic acid a,c-diamide adenosyltransferase [Betaproteobacteria bacterium]
MGYRLSKIYTRTGDDGTTGLSDGARVRKDSLRVECLGEIDELNSQIGLVAAENVPAAVARCLTEIQHDLFDLGKELSSPGTTALSGARVAYLETVLDALNASLPPLKEFVLPGGSRTASLAHVARAVCRRAERRLVGLGDIEPISGTARRYINRLSDLLFVMARFLNREGGSAEVLWDPRRGDPPPVQAGNTPVDK